MSLPPVPQIGRLPVAMSAAQQAELLKASHPADQRDPFASDPHHLIRLYGRLALRRSSPADRVTDYLVIGDICARMTVGDDDRLLIFYAGKTLMAYRRASELADNPIERASGEFAVEQFIRWLCQAARAVPTRRNLAVALWAIADRDLESGAVGSADEQMVDLLLDLFRRPPEAAAERQMTHSDTAPGVSESALSDATHDDGASRLLPLHAQHSTVEVDAHAADLWDDPGSQDMLASDLSGRSGSAPEAAIPPTELPTMETPAIQPDAFMTGEYPRSERDLTALLDAQDRDINSRDAISGLDAVADEALTSMERDLSASLNSDIHPPRHVPLRTPSDRLGRSPAFAAALTTQDVEPLGEQGEFECGQVIEGRFEVVGVKRGGMGVVYLCYDRVLREPIALKTFQSKFLNNPRAIARFEQEALTWIRLEKHRHIVQARLVETVTGRPHILLEHISGPEGLDADLRSWIEHKRITIPLALEFALGIALGMQHAVQRVPGLVHRDLKPANILVTHDGIAKVTDFGLVRSVDSDDSLISAFASLSGDDQDERLTRAGAIIGTVPYMSPEQCRSDSVDVRSDIYAFGCVLYEMLTGRHVFQARKFDDWLRAHQEQAPCFPDDSAAIPQGLAALTLRCLEKQPEARPQSWAEIVEALAALYTEIYGQPPEMEIAGPALEARELMDKGYSLTELRRYDEAIEAYDDAIARKPDYAWAWARKARTLRLINRLDEAMRCYDEAIRLQPQYGWAWRGKGIIHDRRGEYEEALRCYVTAADCDPNEVWNWFNQADALLKLNRPDDALPCLQRALECDPAHPNSWAHMGQIYRQTGRYQEAVDAYRRAIDIDPHYAWAYNGCGLALKMLGRLDEALAAFQNAARYDPDEFWHWYNLTEILIDLRRGHDAIQPAEELTRIAPTSAIAWAKFGQVLRYARRLEEAVAAYRRAVEYDPNYAWAWNGLGIVYERLGRFEDALQAYRRTAACGLSGEAGGEISRAWLWYNQGNLLTVLGRYDEALPALRQAVEVDPGHVHSWARMGNVYRQMKRFDEAAAALEKALALDPRYVWAWNELGITREQQERYPEALEAYRKAAEFAPDDASYIYSQADVLVAIGQYAGALDLLDLSLKLDRTNARTWAKHGQVLRRLGRPEDAVRSYSRAIEIDPGYAWAWNGRGQTLLALGQIDEAVASFRRAVEIDPVDVWYAYNLGDALVQAERFAEAVSALELTTQIHPQHAESWAKLGQAYRRLERCQDAVRAYDRALAVEPGYAWAWFGRGNALEALGKREEAVANYERAIEYDPNPIGYHTYLIDLLLKLNRKQDAARVSDAAVRHLPDNAVAWARRGQVQRRLGDFAGALISYQRAVEIDPTYAWAWNGLGLAYLQLQQPDQALDAFRTAAEHQPNDVWFWHNCGDALLMLDLPDKAVEMFDRALALDPLHEPSERKKVIALAMLQADDTDDTGGDL